MKNNKFKIVQKNLYTNVLWNMIFMLTNMIFWIPKCIRDCLSDPLRLIQNFGCLQIVLLIMLKVWRASISHAPHWSKLGKWRREIISRGSFLKNILNFSIDIGELSPLIFYIIKNIDLKYLHVIWPDSYSTLAFKG